MVFEPAYGVLNARMVFTPNQGNWTADLWATNITDEQYVNGGFDTRTVWGFNFSVIGQPRAIRRRVQHQLLERAARRDDAAARRRAALIHAADAKSTLQARNDGGELGNVGN